MIWSKWLSLHSLTGDIGPCLSSFINGVPLLWRPETAKHEYLLWVNEIHPNDPRKGALAYNTLYRDPGINGPVRSDEVKSGLTGQSLLRTLCESFAWWTCNIRTQTLSEMCISLNCIGVSRQLSRLMSRLKHQEKQFEDRIRQSPSGYVPTVLFCSHMSLGIFICRRRLVSISGNFILSCISVSTIPYLWHNGQHSCWICPDLRILCKKCNIALFVSSLHDFFKLLHWRGFWFSAYSLGLVTGQGS